jgi:hypothetical protein
MGDMLEQSLETAELGPDGFRDIGDGPATRGKDIDWLTIADSEQSVVDDVRAIREHPLVPRDPDLRLHLRRRQRRPPRRGGRGDRSWKAVLNGRSDCSMRRRKDGSTDR